MTPQENVGASIFIFHRVYYQPLDVNEASQCMKDFAETATIAIQQLHGHGYIHGDIRLPNICFSRTFKAVLIDLDNNDCRTEFTASQDWRAFGSVLSSLTGPHVEAWTHFVKHVKAGNEPDINVLQPQGNVMNQDTVEVVLRRRGW